MFLSYASHLHRSHHRRDGSDDSTFIVKDNNDQGGCHVHRTDGCGDGIDRTGRGRNSVTSSSSPPPSTSNSQQPKPSSPPSPQPQQHQQRQQHAHQFLNYVVLNDSYHTRNKEITTPITTTTAATVMNATHVSIDKVPTDKEQNTDGHLLFEETSTDRKIHDSHKFQNKCDLHRFLEDDMMKNIIIAASSCTSADGIDASSTTTKLLLKSFRKSARQATTITNDETNNKINANDDDIAMESFYRSILFNIFASSSSSEEVEEFHGNEEVMKTTQTKEKLNHSKNNDFAKAVDNTIGNEEVDPFELLWNEDSKSIVFEDNPQQHSFKSSSFSEEEGDSLDLLLHKEKAERNELRFLRLVVKNLVETIILTSRTNDDTRHHQKQQQQQQQQQPPVVVTESRKQHHQGEAIVEEIERRLDSNGIPTHIEFENNSNDLLKPLQLHRRISSISSPNTADFAVEVFEDKEDEEDGDEDEAKKVMVPYNTLFPPPMDESDLQYPAIPANRRGASVLELQNGEICNEKARNITIQMDFNGTFVRGTYTGDVQHGGVPHGHGVLRFHNRDLYIGEFYMGFIHGQGTYFGRCSTTTSNGNNRNIMSTTRIETAGTSKSTLTVSRGYFEYNQFVGTDSTNQQI